MTKYVKDLTFVAEGQGYLLMANTRGELVRVSGLTEKESASVVGRHQPRPSKYITLLARIAEISA